MPRSARLDIPGLLQHVIVRGIERCDIFLDDEDRSHFLERFTSLLIATETRCFAWSLMSNHFHLLLKPTLVPLSLFMRRLLTGYAVVFNRKHSRSGHLFQNRYKSIVCEEESYLLELVRYIHLNPLRAGLVRDLPELDRYAWSGHAVLMGNRTMESQEAVGILERFGKNKSRARMNYRQFIADGIAVGRRRDLVGGGLRRSRGEKESTDEIECFDERVLGSGACVEGLFREEELHMKSGKTISIPELIVRISRALELEPETVMHPSKTRRLADARGIICYFGVRKHGYMGTEVGKELHLGPTGVSIAIRRGERSLKTNPQVLNKIVMSIIDK